MTPVFLGLDRTHVMQHIQVPLAYVVTDTHKIGCLAFGKRPIPYIDYVVGSTCSANTTVTVLSHCILCLVYSLESVVLWAMHMY